jgi:ERCC4-related helicase
MGAKVRLHYDHSKRGYVVNPPRLYNGQYDYLVLFAGEDERWYSETDLEHVHQGMLPYWEPRDFFLRDFLLEKLKSPLSDNLYAVSASRTSYEAYQFRPVLKFLGNPEQRILIADEVGLGKTIEAAIIYLELKARLNINRVLVLCPSRLKLKWQSELSNRFSEEFVDITTQRARTLLEDYRRTDYVTFRGIASFESMRRPEFIEAFADAQLPIDLLIVDEAHYLRNSETQTHQIAQILADNSDAVVFLTATPLQLGNDNLFSLLSILAPGDFNDPNIFSYQIEPNKFVNQASRYLAAGDLHQAYAELRKVETTLYGVRYAQNPLYARVLQQLTSSPTDLETQIDIQRDLLELNTISRVFSRTRKREVTTSAKRAAYTIPVRLTTEETGFYHAILAMVRRQLKMSTGATGFGIVTKERMAASCLIALRQDFEHASTKRVLPQLDSEYIESEAEEYEDSAYTTYDETKRLLQLSAAIGPVDSKFDRFSEILNKVLNESPFSKILVFSTFRGTLNYLYGRLSALKIKVDVIHGGVKITERHRIIDDFRTNPELRVLLSSEVGAEGLDFQFCDVLFNYDLPWNPMQIEQRIGRLDRFGQKAERIRIYNLYLENTIETRIFLRVYDRIGIFKQSIGDLEDILGEEIHKLTRDVIQKDLTSIEQEELAEQAAQRVINRRKDIEDVDARKHELLGQDDILGQMVESTIASGRTIHAEEVRALVKTFLDDAFPRVEFTKDDMEDTWCIRLSPELTTYLFKVKQEQRTTAFQGSENWAIAMARNAPIAITFNNELALQRPLLELITTNHLLAGAARTYWQQKGIEGIPARFSTLQGPLEEVGPAHFFVFTLDQQGMEKRRTLQPVIVLDDGRMASETAKTLLAQLQVLSATPDLEEDNLLYTKALDTALSEIVRIRNDRVSYLAERQSSLIQSRVAAVETSFDGKIKKAYDTLDKVRDSRLVRLYQGRVANLEAQKFAKVEQIQTSGGVAISYLLIATGRALIVNSAYRN